MSRPRPKAVDQNINQEEIYLLSDFHIEKPQQDITLAQNLTQLRNILSIKRENVEREAYMSVFLEILTLPQIKKDLVENENIFLIHELKKNFRFDPQQPKGPIDTNFIIDNIVKYIEIGLKHMQAYSEVTSILYQCINLLSVFVESYYKSNQIKSI